MIVFDHLKLIKGNLSEMKRFRQHLLSAEVGVVDECEVLHEKDDSCCRQEPWAKTWKRIYGALKPPVETYPVNVDETADQSIIRQAMENRE